MFGGGGRGGGGGYKSNMHDNGFRNTKIKKNILTQMYLQFWGVSFIYSVHVHPTD